MIDQAGLQVAPALSQFIENEALPGTGIDKAAFWSGFSAGARPAPRNRELLAERDRLQQELDTWHRAHPGPVRDHAAYRAFLEQIGYLVPVRRTSRQPPRTSTARSPRRPARSSSCRCRTRATR